MEPSQSFLSLASVFQRAAGALVLLLAGGGLALGASRALRRRERGAHDGRVADRGPNPEDPRSGFSTREVPVGSAVELDHGGRRKGRVLTVDDRSFLVEVEGLLRLAAGEEVGVTIRRERGSVHRASCTVLRRTVAPSGGERLSLSHDESPVRLQRREYVRVPAEGPVSVRPLLCRATAREADSAFTARLVDVGGGGLRVMTSVSLPVGLVAEVAFAVGEADFRDLRAKVLACGPTETGAHCARLQLKGLPERDRERLTTAVSHAEARARGRG